MKIVITGGGTGGHLFPALLIAERLIENGHQVFYFGNKHYIEAKETKKRGIPFYSVPSKNTSKKDIKFFWDNGRGVMRAIHHFKKIKPDVVYSTGGFTTAPVLAAATLLKIPFILHEQNAVIGLVNRLFRKQATSFIHSFPNDVQEYETHIGNLSRYNGETIDRIGSHTVFLGGSGGAKFINDLSVKYAINNPLKKIILVSGKKFEVQDKPSNLEVYQFVEDMKEIYAFADVVIARAGASTLAELSHFGIPSIIIPMPNSADNHQNKNALYYEGKGSIIKINQTEDTLTEVQSVLEASTEEHKRNLGVRFRYTYPPNAEQRIIKIILQCGE